VSIKRKNKHKNESCQENSHRDDTVLKEVRAEVSSVSEGRQQPTVATLREQLPSARHPTERLDRAHQHRGRLLRLEAEGKEGHLTADQQLDTDELVAERQSEDGYGDEGQGLEDESESAVSRKVADDNQRQIVRIDHKGERSGAAADERRVEAEGKGTVPVFEVLLEVDGE
jgi:hypothetical protein